jgi:hypothetical protein
MTDYQKGDLFTHLLLFARQLKEKGLKITPARVTDAFRSLEYIDLSDRSDFAETLKANFVSSVKEMVVFSEVFRYFWGRISERPPKEGFSADEGLEGDETLQEGPLAAAREDAPQPAERNDEKSLSKGYSPQEIFLVKDFNQYSLEDQGVWEKETARLISRWVMRVSRRRRSASKGREMDFRRTIRKAVRNGGEILEWFRRQRKVKPLKIISLCDVSGSMEASTRFTLQFIFGLQKAFPRSEAFVFSTRLTRVTEVVKKNQRTNALTLLGRRVQDWSGGTRLGPCLKIFNEVWGKGMAAGSAVVILFSDGWDRGDPALLEAEMKRLKRRAHRIIWMNPLLGTPGYQPLTQGMRAALPYIDYFLPANDLKSLQGLGEVLADQLV